MRPVRASMLVVGLVAAAGLSACGTANVGSVSVRAPIVLASRPSEAGWRYTLDSVTSCQVTDALTVIGVAGDRSVRVSSVSARYAYGNAPPGTVSMKVVAMPADRAWGYAGATPSAPMLRGWRAIPPPGAVLLPEKTSHLAYVVVLHVRLLADAPGWGVRAVVLHYLVGSTARAATFRQFLAVPATRICARA